ncbi:MAG: DUF72 domain-containing protein [Deltaproteobacteria bacterium]|nr:DUF72 domain-containing protein [Deltaproteobacteria bacterium]
MKDNRSSSARCQLLVGTSGYSYVEWVDAGFYPNGTPSGKMLSFYARTFPVTELNYTWYQMPKAEALERMRRQVSSAFWFTAKLNRRLTHEIDPGGWRGHVREYREGVAPLLQAGRLAAILLQFPSSFHRVPHNRRYLADLLDELAGLPLAVEFRHVSWATDKVFTELQRRKVTLVTVDTPDLPQLFPALNVVTNPEFFYVRFHGRNARGWRSANMQRQFDYDYSDLELQEWTDSVLESMMDRARRGFIFFNNHVRAQAPDNARKLIEHLVGRRILDEKMTTQVSHP